jgi:hypothetical protein
MLRYRVVAGPTRALGAHGECVYAENLIIVDVEKHTSRHELRSTLLHEMAHAAAGSRSRGHDSKFFAEIEFLLEQGVRLKMGLPETGNLPILDSVPDTFPLAKKALARAYRQVQRKMLRDPMPEFMVDDGYLCAQFEEAGQNGFSWREALLVIGREYGLIDIDEKVLCHVETAVKLYRRAHRTGQNERRQLARALGHSHSKR